MKYCIRKFLNAKKYSLELEEFEPKGGYESFLQKLCIYLEEPFGNWYNGVESGLGHMTYKGYKLETYWTDFPFHFSFDCRDETMAIELKEKLEVFLETIGADFLKAEKE